MCPQLKEEPFSVLGGITFSHLDGPGSYSSATTSAWPGRSLESKGWVSWGRGVHHLLVGEQEPMFTEPLPRARHGAVQVTSMVSLNPQNISMR